MYTTDQGVYWELATSQAEIARWDGSKLTTLHTVAGGCNLLWSPDGRYLIHTHPIKGYVPCFGTENTLEIVDTETLTNSKIVIDGIFGLQPQWLLVP